MCTYKILKNGTGSVDRMKLLCLLAEQSRRMRQPANLAFVSSNPVLVLLSSYDYDYILLVCSFADPCRNIALKKKMLDDKHCRTYIKVRIFAVFFTFFIVLLTNVSCAKILFHTAVGSSSVTKSHVVLNQKRNYVQALQLSSRV